MRLIIFLVKNEGMIKNMMLEVSTPRVISLRTLLQERRVDQNLLNTRDLTPLEVKS